MGGFALVNNNKITILVNEAELGSVRLQITYFYIIKSLGFYFKHSKLSML